MKIGGFDCHPAADAYPLLIGPDLDNFIASIEQDGQRCPIVLYAPITHTDKVTSAESVILDGRNRMVACIKLRIEPIVRYFDESTEGDPVLFVKSMNNDRRHQEVLSRVLSLQRVVDIAKRDRKSVV